MKCESDKISKTEVLDKLTELFKTFRKKEDCDTCGAFAEECYWCALSEAIQEVMKIKANFELSWCQSCKYMDGSNMKFCNACRMKVPTYYEKIKEK